MQNFRDLSVWKAANGVVLQVYRLTKDLPASENFGLTANLRRTSIAMASRVAEGAGKSSDHEFGVELKRARAIAYELEYLVLLAHDLGYLSPEHQEQATRNITEVRKMISGLLSRLATAP